MSDQSTSMWLKFFRAAGIQAGIDKKYALIFDENRIRMDMLMDLDKEILKDMGITAMGDIIAILKHSKKAHAEAKEEAVEIPKPSSSSVGSAPAPKAEVSTKTSRVNFVHSGMASVEEILRKTEYVERKVGQRVPEVELSTRSLGITLPRSSVGSNPADKKIVVLKKRGGAEQALKEEVPVQKKVRVLPEHEGKYKIKMPEGTTPRTQKALQSRLGSSKAVKSESAVESLTSFKTVFDRLGDSKVSSSTGGDKNIAEPVRHVLKSEAASRASVFNRLGGKDAKSESRVEKTLMTIPSKLSLPRMSDGSFKKSEVAVSSSSSSRVISPKAYASSPGVRSQCCEQQPSKLKSSTGGNLRDCTRTGEGQVTEVQRSVRPKERPKLSSSCVVVVKSSKEEKPTSKLRSVVVAVSSKGGTARPCSTSSSSQSSSGTLKLNQSNRRSLVDVQACDASGVHSSGHSGGTKQVRKRHPSDSSVLDIYLSDTSLASPSHSNSSELEEKDKTQKDPRKPRKQPEKVKTADKMMTSRDSRRDALKLKLKKPNIMAGSHPKNTSENIKAMKTDDQREKIGKVTSGNQVLAVGSSSVKHVLTPIAATSNESSEGEFGRFTNLNSQLTASQVEVPFADTISHENPQDNRETKPLRFHPRELKQIVVRYVNNKMRMQDEFSYKTQQESMAYRLDNDHFVPPQVYQGVSTVPSFADRYSSEENVRPNYVYNERPSHILQDGRAGPCYNSTTADFTTGSPRISRDRFFHGSANRLNSEFPYGNTFVRSRGFIDTNHKGEEIIRIARPSEDKTDLAINPVSLKLMTKMGWQPGLGLGKQNQGRKAAIESGLIRLSNVGLGFGKD